MAQRCAVCAHPRRAEVDAALRGSHNASEIAEQLGVTRYSVMRHREKHLVRSVARSASTTVRTEQVSSPQEGETPPEVIQAPPPPTRLLDPQTAFLTSYAAEGDMQAALKAAGATRAQFRQWQEHDESFLQRFRQAEVDAVETLEAEARTRAVAGSLMVRRVYRHGLLYEEIREYRPSDTMLVKLLQAHKPEKYGEKLTLTQTQVIKAVDADAWHSV